LTGSRGAPSPDHGLWWKRPLDLAIGIPLTFASLPLIAVLALLVGADSPGPAFFRQERVGRAGRSFRMWKLRTMQTGCRDDRHRQAAAAWFAGRASAGDYKTLEDPRITRVGRWVRRLELDELPQLFNVLHGEMSLVGPRPAIPYELTHYQPTYLDRLKVPPGMTGLWQVTRRERLSAAEMMELDLRYVRRASPWLDVKTLVRTAGVVVGRALGFPAKAMTSWRESAGEH
jgi:lipopolysaccharide/colanic/teichoic acid biosynthesis glycosyltransferase